MTALLRKLLDIAGERGFKFVFFRTSSKDNEMLRLALGLGFEIVGYKAREWQDDQGNWEPAVYLEVSIGAGA